MPRLSTAIDRANAILRAHGTPFRLREGHGSRWLSIYENCPGRRVRERSARGYAARDDRDVERLCSRLLEHAQNCPDQGLDDLFTGREPAPSGKRPTSTSPTWPEICQAVVAFQRGQGVNMNLVGPFKGQGYFRLLTQDRPATLEDVRRFALHTTESLKEQLEDPSAVLLLMATHRQGFRQKREVVSLLRRAGFGAIAPQELSEELKGMVNRKKLALVAAGQSRRRIPSTAAVEEWLDPQGPWGQHGQQLSGLSFIALQHRQVVGVGIEGCQQLGTVPNPLPRRGSEQRTISTGYAGADPQDLDHSAGRCSLERFMREKGIDPDTCKLHVGWPVITKQGYGAVQLTIGGSQRET